MTQAVLLYRNERFIVIPNRIDSSNFSEVVEGRTNKASPFTEEPYLTSRQCLHP